MAKETITAEQAERIVAALERIALALELINYKLPVPIQQAPPMAPFTPYPITPIRPYPNICDTGGISGGGASLSDLNRGPLTEANYGTCSIVG